MGLTDSVTDVLQRSFDTGFGDGGEPPVRYCPSCGSEVLPSWKHCARCGDSLPGSGPSGLARRTDGPDPRHVLWDEITTLVRQSRFAEAQAAVLVFLDRYPDSARGCALAATIFLKLYKIDEAKTYLDRAKELDPTSSFAHLSSAQYYLALGTTREALDDLAKAEVAAADNIPLYNSIRVSISQLQEKTRWSFSRESTLPANSWVSRLFKRR